MVSFSLVLGLTSEERRGKLPTAKPAHNLLHVVSDALRIKNYLKPVHRGPSVVHPTDFPERCSPRSCAGGSPAPRHRILAGL